MIYKIVAQLMRKDLTQFRRGYKGKFFDTCFLLFTNLIVFGYFMPQVGVSTSYGPFILIGAIASFGIFDIIGQVGELIFDIEGERSITFTLALPIPSWVVLSQLALKWALNTFLLCVPLFFIGKLILWTRFDLTQISLWRTLIIFPSICLFFGFFSLWITGIVRKIDSLSSLFLRLINPIFMFGGYFFTWKDITVLSPILSYILLINPMIYVMEGLRAACLGQEGYLPFWICCCVLWIFTLTLGAHGIRLLKRRLDCV